MKLDYFTFTPEEFDQALTTAMRVTVGALEKDGLLKEEDGDAWLEERACIQVRQTSCWQRWIKKAFPQIKDGESVTTIVKLAG